MDKVKVFLPNNKYEIIIGDDAIKLSFFLGHPKRSRKTLVLTDRNVAKFHEDKIRSLIISDSLVPPGSRVIIYFSLIDFL